MIDARNHWMQKKSWPIQSRYLGCTGYYFAKNKLEPSLIYYQDNRVYSDEIELAHQRIKDVKYFKECYEGGYTKDINWP